MSAEHGTMMRFSDSGLAMADPKHDIRGRTVSDREGNEIGEVDDLLIDPEEKQVRLLRVKHGGLFGIGATPLFIPVEAIVRVTDDEVGIDRSRAQIAEAPQYDPELVDETAYYSDLYRYYGYAPYWGAG